MEGLVIEVDFSESELILSMKEIATQNDAHFPSKDIVSLGIIGKCLIEVVYFNCICHPPNQGL